MNLPRSIPIDLVTLSKYDGPKAKPSVMLVNPGIVDPHVTIRFPDVNDGRPAIRLSRESAEGLMVALSDWLHKSESQS